MSLSELESYNPHELRVTTRACRNNATCATRAPHGTTSQTRGFLMLKNTKSLTMGALFALSVAFLPQLTPAMAQTPAAAPLALPGTCVPTFDASKNVYVAPELAKDPTYPESLNGLKEKLKQEDAKYGIQTIVVACQMQFDSRLYTPAVSLATSLAKRWENAPGFNKEKFLLVTYVRQAHSATGMSRAALAGSWLVSQGFGPAAMNDRNGPLGRDYRSYLNDLPSMLANVTKQINNDLDARAQQAQAAAARAAQQAQAAEEHTAHMHFVWLMTLLAVLAAVGSIAGLWQLGRFRKAKAPFEAKLAEVAPKFEKSDQNYITLKNSYMGFFKDNSDWSTRLTDETLAELLLAGKEFDQMSVRNKYAADRLAAARAAFALGNFFQFAGFASALELLTSEPIVIVGAKKEVKELTFFGSATNDETFTFDILLAKLAEGFQSANSKAAAIMEAVDKGGSNKDAVDAELKDIQTLRDSAIAKGMSFAPYQSRYDSIVDDLESLAGQLSRDPLGALKRSETAKADTDALKADIENAHTLKDALAPVERTLADATARTLEVRGQNVKLEEEGGNPYHFLVKAREQLEAANAALTGGKLAEAQTAMTAASTAAAQAHGVIDAVLAATSSFEKSEAETTARVASLKADSPEFVASLEASMKQAHTAYTAQQFLAASKLVADVNSTIDARDSTRDTCDDVTVIVNAVYAKLQEPAKADLQAATFTTSAAAISAFNTLVDQSEALKTEASAEVADWHALSVKAQALHTTAKAIDSEFEQQRASWRSATAEYAKLSTAVTAAFQFAQLGSTGTAATESYNAANTAFDALSKDITVSNSDWASLAARAQQATAQAEMAERLARADSEDCTAAQRVLQEAESVINGANRDYGYGVQANLSSAISKFSAASAAFTDTKDYAEATRLARQAISQARTAQSDAVDEADDRAQPVVVVTPRPTVIIGGGPVYGGPVIGGVVVDDGPYVGGGGTYVDPQPQPDYQPAPQPQPDSQPAPQQQPDSQPAPQPQPDYQQPAPDTNAGGFDDTPDTGNAGGWNDD
jgi:hypothetical protein